MLKGIIFDMDGVLIDSEPFHYKMWKQTLKDIGIDLRYPVYEPCVGSTMEVLMDILHRNYGIDRNDTDLISAMRKRKENVIQKYGYPEIPGVPEMIKRLKEAGYLLAVASSSPEYYIKNVVSTLGISSYFDVLCSGESVKHPKPAPDVFLKAAGELNLEPGECLVVEDSTNGSRAAKAANMTCVGYNNGGAGNQDLSSAAILVEGYDEVDGIFMEKVYRRDHHIPVMIGETNRITVSEIDKNDITDLQKIADNNTVDFHLPFLGGTSEEIYHAFSSYRTHMYELCDMGIWVIRIKDTKDVIGCVGLEPKTLQGTGSSIIELGYLLNEEYRGNGYAEEACAIALAAAKALEIEKVYCRIHPDNSSSIKLAQKLGFWKEEASWIIQEDHYLPDHGWYVYSL